MRTDTIILSSQIHVHAAMVNVAVFYFVTRKDKILKILFKVNAFSHSRGGGGGTQVLRGAAPSLRISRKKGSFFKTSACPQFCKRRIFFCTQVRSMGVKIPLQSTKYPQL